MQPTTFSAKAQYFSFIAPAAIYLRSEHTLDAHSGGVHTYPAVSVRARLRGEKKQKQFSFPSPPLLILSLPSDKRPCFLLLRPPRPPPPASECLLLSWQPKRRWSEDRGGGGDDSGNVVSRTRYREVAAAEGNSLLSDVYILIEVRRGKYNWVFRDVRAVVHRDWMEGGILRVCN